MCLAKAFVNNLSGQPIFQDIARVRINGNKVKMETLFGEEKVVLGRIIEIYFTAPKILMRKPRTIDTKD